ncbi:MAG: hypothetical protein QME94_03580, partial [Anaerolineae bacterium]|nr:hypothetical protein [Anaerolineae bacterium]
LSAAEAWPVHLLYGRMQGAAYYVVERGRRPRTLPNRRYEEPLPPPLRDVPLEAPDLGLERGLPLYSAFVHRPGRFGWLGGAEDGAGACL